MGVESQSRPGAESSPAQPEQVAQLPGQLSTTIRDRTVTEPDGVNKASLAYAPVTQLREWGTDTVHPLPGPDIAEWLIGSDPTAALSLVDPSGLVSRRHARLVRHRAWWKLEDLRS